MAPVTRHAGENRQDFEAGEFVHTNLRGANEEYVNVISVDAPDQTSEPVVTKSHGVGEKVPRTIFPTPVLRENDDVASYGPAVASPDSRTTDRRTTGRVPSKDAASPTR